jgi:hypothetical protein
VLSDLVVRPTGRIGNQLFVIAAGFQAARLSGRQLRADLSALSAPGAEYSPEVLGFDWSFLSDDHEAGLPPARPRRSVKGASRLQNVISGLTAGVVPELLFERDGRFEPRLLRPAHFSRIYGYFQHAEYARSARRLGFPHRLSLVKETTWLTDVRQRAREESPVVVVVRLGDYRAHPDTLGLLEPEYFEEGLRRVDPGQGRRIWLFCDEAEAGLRYLPESVWDRVWVVPQPEGIAKESILLGASLGHDYVIANSTFAWWAAWMSDPGSRVVAPDPWLRAYGLRGILPDKWIRLAWDWDAGRPIAVRDGHRRT